jgi:hypothetical protein
MAYCVLYVLVSHVCLDRPGILPLGGEVAACGMAEHTEVDGYASIPAREDAHSLSASWRGALA